MRVALISDLHGNSIALEAVLREIRKQGVDRTVCLGDVATLGIAPREVIEQLDAEQIPTITGNHDAFLLDPQLAQTYTNASQVLEAIDWCRSELSTRHLALVSQYVPKLDLELGSGATLSLFHGSPRSHMEDVLITTGPEELDVMLGPVNASVLAGGHTHIQMLRQHRGMLLVNPGSVGMPFKEFVDHKPPTLMPWAEYAIVEASTGQSNVALYRVPLKQAHLRGAAAASSNPFAPWLASQYPG